MKTLFAPALIALYFLLQSAGFVQAKTATGNDGLDSLRTSGAKATAATANFQHHLFHSKKRNHFRLAVAHADNEATKMRIYDQQGNLVHRADLASDTVVCDLDVTLLQPGSYVVKILAGDRVAEEKFTVE